ncbi:ABC transporter membrane-spanning protein [Streptomyces spiroverticillatus]|uniref:ABC transporter membrane-spanning protein n=1 Tax=Streptomyces finlayi TaxID=67296 RepID=A0A919CDJ1_9ACTN|nr:ABC transporter permease [Streptomyces finlayi]GHA33629.1 ABC transporter membrane-spanning protein [Streptomyces spiroverticillatus]GHD11377.1 ABC transporter membrane-spanning protein [Streptomyces finlayi]
MSAVAAPAAGKRQLAGLATLLKLALRRDRIMLPVWVLVLGVTMSSGAGTVDELYGTAAERAKVAASMTGSGSLRALYGSVFDTSVGGLVAWRLGGFVALMAGAMSLIIVVRHTREEEETGRQEMLSAGTLGRRAPLAAALLTALIANTALALVTFAGLASSTQDATGSLALGLGIGATGMFFAGVAAVTAQLSESARLAKGLAVAVLGTSFVLRAAGDAATTDSSSVLNWLSPLGWTANIRPYADERALPLILLLAGAALLAWAAQILAARRDVGMSFLPARPGPATGRLTSAYALALRLQRGTVAAWAAGFLACGLLFGGMTGGVTDLVGGNAKTAEIFQRMGGNKALDEAFLAAMVGMLGMVAALYAVGSVLRLHAEETSGRAEPVLAGAVGRLRWAAGHLVIAFGGSVLVLLCGGLGLALGYGKSFGPVLGACLVQVPAVWTLAGLAVLLHGVVPSLTQAAWGLTGLCLAVGWIGPVIGAPDALLRISPFGHLPKVPGAEMAWTPVLALTAVAAALVGAGLAGLRRRDVG